MRKTNSIKNKTNFQFLLFLLLTGLITNVFAQENTLIVKRNGITFKKADSPLFNDPVYHGSTDPMVCFNHQTNQWYMYYTSRRANVKGLNGIEAIHGSEIGIAASDDGGATWQYKGTCNIDYHPDENPTYWAPEIIEYEGTYHMYLTYVPGIFNNWDHPRDIVHLISKDGVNWKHQSVLQLSSKKVIDACIFHLPDGTWRLWYNNEKDHKSVYYAESTDLYNWTDKGKVDMETIGEGPNVIYWHNTYYMFVDEWKGLSVFSSSDALVWEKQSEYLISGIPENPESMKELTEEQKRRVKMINGTKGNHADIEIANNRAYMFYFSHIPKDGDNRQTSVYVQELIHNDDGTISCDPLAPCYINLNRVETQIKN